MGRHADAMMGLLTILLVDSDANGVEDPSRRSGCLAAVLAHRPLGMDQLPADHYLEIPGDAWVVDLGHLNGVRKLPLDGTLERSRKAAVASSAAVLNRHGNNHLYEA